MIVPFLYFLPIDKPGQRVIFEISELADVVVKAHVFSIADVKGALDALPGMEYRTVERYAPIDITEVFDESSEEGTHLLDFLTHVVDFRKNASPDLLASFMALVKEIAQRNKARDKNEKKYRCDGHYIDEYWQILIVSKNKWILVFFHLKTRTVDAHSQYRLYI